MTKKLLAVVLSLFLIHSTAAQTFLQINGLSLHDRSGYNGFNYGGGIEQSLTDQINLAGGWYYNSEYRGSTYAYARYRIFKNTEWDFGLAGGMVTGYKRAAVMPMAFPELCYHVFCAMAVPKIEKTGASVLGLHLKVPLDK